MSAAARLPRIIRLLVWLWRVRTSRADLYIGGRHDPYMLRWNLLPKDKYPINLYLHRMVRDDDDRSLHDHPWWFVSIILAGGYIEVRPREAWIWRAVRRREKTWGHLWPGLLRDTLSEEIGPGRLLFHRSEDAHRLMLRRPPHLGGESWSLVITGRPVRDWGFYCPQGWRDARDFARVTELESAIGRGCD